MGTHSSISRGILGSGKLAASWALGVGDQFQVWHGLGVGRVEGGSGSGQTLPLEMPTPDSWVPLPLTRGRRAHRSLCLCGVHPSFETSASSELRDSLFLKYFFNKPFKVLESLCLSTFTHPVNFRTCSSLKRNLLPLDRIYLPSLISSNPLLIHFLTS